MVGKQAYDILMGFRVNWYFWIFETGIAGILGRNRYKSNCG